MGEEVSQPLNIEAVPNKQQSGNSPRTTKQNVVFFLCEKLETDKINYVKLIFLDLKKTHLFINLIQISLRQIHTPPVERKNQYTYMYYWSDGVQMGMP